MTRILIAGFAESSRRWADEQPKDVEIWGMNEAHQFLPFETHNVTRWFQIHPRDFKEKEKVAAGAPSKLPPNTFGRNEKHVKWLRECKVPLVMNRDFEDIPNAEPFPFDEVKAKFGPCFLEDGEENKPENWRLYLTSTPAYMMAYALAKVPDLEEIRFSGIELAIGTEYYWQRPCFEWYCGYASGKGIRVIRPPMGCAILSAPVYAVDKPLIQPKDFNREPKLVLATMRGVAKVKQDGVKFAEVAG